MAARPAKKVLLWLRCGTRVVLVADPGRHLFVVHRPHAEPEILTASDSFAAEDVVPGWVYRVGDAFPAK